MTTSDPRNVFAADPPKRSVRTIYLILFGGLIALVLGQLLISVRRSGIEQALSASERHWRSAQLIAAELRQSSDDLTRIARTFAVTGNPAFEQYFDAILAIREGRKPRPADYDKVYWDLVIALGRQPPATGPAVSLDALFADAGLAAEELAKLRESKRSADRLALLEQLAMNAAKGIYRDANRQFNLKGAPDPAYATRLLNGPEHHQAKARVMKPLYDFQMLLDRRFRSEIDRLQLRSLRSARAEAILILTTALSLILAFILVNRRIIAPLLELTAAAANVGRNGFFPRVLAPRNDELGTLAGALNRMSETVEAKTRESQVNEERFQSLLEASPNALILIEATDCIALINRQAELLLGRARSELAGQPFASVLPELARRDAKPAPDVRREFTLRRKDGTDVPIEAGFSAIPAPDGGEWLCCVLADSTARRTAEVEISRLRALQSAVLNAIPYPLFIKDTQARFLSRNQAYEEAFGVNRDFLAGKAALEPGGTAEAVREKFDEEEAEVVRAASNRTCELPIVYPDQVEHLMRYTTAGFRLPDGSPGGLIGLLEDITDRKQAEAQVSAQRSLFQTVIDQVNACVYVKDIDGQFLFVNRNYRELLGRTAADLIGRTAVEALGRKAGAAHDERDRDVRQTRELRERKERLAINGGARDFIARMFPLVNEQGELFGTAEVSTEITELKRTQDELAIARTLSLPDPIPQPVEKPMPIGAVPEPPSSEIRPAPVLAANDEPLAAVATAVEIVTNQILTGPTADPETPVHAPDQSADFQTGNTTEGQTTLAGSESGAPAETAGQPPPVENELSASPVAKPKPERKKRVRKPKDASPPDGTEVASASEGLASVEAQPAVELQTNTETSSSASASQLWEGAEAGLEPHEIDRGSDLPIADVFARLAAHAGSKPGATDKAVISDELAATEPVAAENLPAVDAKPEKKKHARKSKDTGSSQPDLFGDYDTSKDEAGPVEVTVDPDGVPAVPGLDLREAMNRLSQPLESIRQQAVRFGATLGQTCQDLRAALATQDTDAARRHAHALAGAAGELSADRLRRLAKTLELALKFEQGDTQAMVADLEREAARVAEGIRQFDALPESKPPDGQPAAAPAAPAELSAPLDTRKLQTALEELAAALEEGDFEAISPRAARLKAIALPAALAANYECLSEMVDNFDYAEAAAVVRSMQGRLA